MTTTQPYNEEVPETIGRNEIDTKVYNSLVSILVDTGEYLNQDRVMRDYPEENENFPYVYYNSFPQNVNYNEGARSAPVGYLVDPENGNTLGEIHVDYERLQFDVGFASKNINLIDDMYYDVKDFFTSFRKSPFKSYRDFHKYCNVIEVNDISANEDSDLRRVLRDEVLQIEIEYKRYMTYEGEPIKSIVHQVDDYEFEVN